MYELYNPATYGYQRYWFEAPRYSLVARVRGCKDGHILMSTTIGQTDENHAYEVVLGSYSNSHVSIRKGSLQTDKVMGGHNWPISSMFDFDLIFSRLRVQFLVY